MLSRSQIMINLRDKDRQRINEITQKCFKCPIEIWAYGSRVNGNSHEASDLDIVIHSEGKTLQLRNEFNLFQKEIENSNIPIIVQSFLWSSLPENMQGVILKNYEILFKRT
jgi:uncharacterized protein